MADLYDRFNGSDNMEDDNDEDIGALGSILSWDDEDEAGVEESVAATSSALEDRDTSSGTSALPAMKDGLPSYMRQFSGLSDTSSGGGFCIPMPNPVNYTAQPQATVDASGQQTAGAPSTQQQQVACAPNTTQQQQQQQPTGQVPAQQQQQTAQSVQQTQTGSIPQQQIQQQVPAQQPPQQPLQQPQVGGTQQQQPQAPAASNPFPVPAMMPNFMLQQPSLFAPNNPQQAMAAFGMASMMQQQAQAQAQNQQQQAQQQPQNQFNKFFLQQMQAQAAVQQAQQQAAQQFSTMQQQAAQSRQMAAPGMMNAMPPQALPSMMAPALRPPPPQQTPVSAPAQPPKPPRAVKRKTPSAPQVPSSEVARPTVVSCSDTDGESGKITSSTESRPPRKKAASSTAKKAKTENGDHHDNHHLDTSGMSSEEKAKANRDRNREHARNTRLRKKAYLEKLKTTVDELCRERDTLVSERAGAASLLVEMHNTRTEVLMSFFALRSSCEQRRELWASILDESCFACVMPVTPYRSFPASEVQVSKCQRTILGIDGMMADTASLHVLLNSLVDRLRYPTTSIEFRYTLVTEDAVVAGNQMMARWVMSTVNAVQCGARMEVAKQGMLCCKFNSAHKIIGLELMFDVMAFMLQLKQAAGSDSFDVVPNTVQTCQRSFDKPMVMTLAERPYTIVQVNKLWEDMTGYKAEDVVGKASCRVLQGEETNRATLDSLMNAVRFKRPSSGLLVNYTRTGKRFRHYVTFYPLSTDSKVTHYVSLTTHLDVIDVPGNTAAAKQPVVAVDANQQGTKTQPLEGQAQLMSQSMVMPGARTATSLAPLSSATIPTGAPTMPHPPLGFFSPPAQPIMPAMPMGKMIPPPQPTIAQPTSVVAASTSASKQPGEASVSSLST